MESRDPKAITERNDLESPLLKLPGELRNRIYRYAVVQDTPAQLQIIETGKTTCTPRRFLHNKSLPPLALASRRLYDEVKPIYLVEETFCLTNFFTQSVFLPEHVEHFRRMIGKHGDEITEVKINRRTHGHGFVRMRLFL